MEKFAKFFEDFIKIMFEGLKNAFEGLVEKETRPAIEKFFNEHAMLVAIGVVAAIVLVIIVAKMKKAS